MANFQITTVPLGEDLLILDGDRIVAKITASVRNTSTLACNYHLELAAGLVSVASERVKSANDATTPAVSGREAIEKRERMRHLREQADGLIAASNRGGR